MDENGAPARPRRIIVGITGASGIIYGTKILETLGEMGVETHLVLSKGARMTIRHESGVSPSAITKLASHSYAPTDLAAPIASGSYRTDGMIVAPCSVKSLAEIASGLSGCLLSRAADVVLKERRRLVLLVRETPLTLIHLRNMTAVTESGGIIALPVPAFYTQPSSLDEVVDQSVGRVLDLFDIDTGRFPRWKEQATEAAPL